MLTWHESTAEERIHGNVWRAWAHYTDDLGWRVWRSPTLLGVKAPSGWVTMRPPPGMTLDEAARHLVEDWCNE